MADAGAQSAAALPRAKAGAARIRTAVVTLVLAQPTWTTWRVGLVVASWVSRFASGRPVISKRAARSRVGPVPLDARIRCTSAHRSWRLGVVIAARSTIVGLLAAVYMVATLTAAIRTEEAFLRGRVRRGLRRYRRSEGEEMAPVQPGARMRNKRISRRCRPADWVRVPCLAGCAANIIVFAVTPMRGAERQGEAVRRGRLAQW